MNSSINKPRLIVLATSMLMVILDSATAAKTALNGIDLCVRTIIPGMFPIIFISSAIACEIRCFSAPYLEKCLRIPANSSGYFLIGLICGYPVGAKLLQNAYDRGELSAPAAARMISFCNNASPAFIIGILASLFSSGWIAISMWVIQILASFLTGCMIPGMNIETAGIQMQGRDTIGKTMTDAIKATAIICGWVILFGVLIGYMQTYILSNLKSTASAILCGLMELTSGVQKLRCVTSHAVRYTISAVLLSLGGVCVLLQTRSVAPVLATKSYMLSRLFHGSISGLLSTFIGMKLFPEERKILYLAPLFISISVVIIMIFHLNKKIVAFHRKL